MGDFLLYSRTNACRPIYPTLWTPFGQIFIHSGAKSHASYFSCRKTFFWQLIDHDNWANTHSQKNNNTHTKKTTNKLLVWRAPLGIPDWNYLVMFIKVVHSKRWRCIWSTAATVTWWMQFDVWRGFMFDRHLFCPGWISNRGPKDNHQSDTREFKCWSYTISNFFFLKIISFSFFAFQCP